MATISVDPKKVTTFKTGDAFYAWLAKNHVREREVWIKIHKVSSGLKSITPLEAIDADLCWGWIDGVRKGLDEMSYLHAIRRGTRAASGARSTSITSPDSFARDGWRRRG
jgi:uncharacterized protein YdeI (YjbR/CyaY-like superfamily)